MAKITLFLGSSSAAKSQAKAVAATLKSEDVDFLPWWEAFTPGRTLLEELDAIRAKVHGAILLFSPEAEATVRGNVVNTPNLNVLFEFGYFYGHFGKSKVAMLKYGDFYLPSDFGGYIHVFGSTFFRRGAVVKVGKRTVDEFGRWVGSGDFVAPESPKAKRKISADALKYRQLRGNGPQSWMGNLALTGRSTRTSYRRTSPTYCPPVIPDVSPHYLACVCTLAGWKACTTDRSFLRGIAFRSEQRYNTATRRAGSHKEQT